MSYLIVDVIRIVLFRCATHKEGVSAGGGGGGRGLWNFTQLPVTKLQR